MQACQGCSATTIEYTLLAASSMSVCPKMSKAKQTAFSRRFPLVVAKSRNINRQKSRQARQGTTRNVERATNDDEGEGEGILRHVNKNYENNNGKRIKTPRMQGRKTPPPSPITFSFRKRVVDNKQT